MIEPCIFEKVTSALCFFNPEEVDEMSSEIAIETLFGNLKDRGGFAEMESTIVTLCATYEKKGYRDGFAAGIKLIMQAMGR